MYACVKVEENQKEQGENVDIEGIDKLFLKNYPGFSVVLDFMQLCMIS